MGTQCLTQPERPTSVTSNMQLTSTIILLALAGLALCRPAADSELTASQEAEIQYLSNFESYRNDVEHHTGGGTYSFVYHVGNAEREEERTSSGEVSGKYAFVAPEGDEYEFKYSADDEGFHVESDALPEAPEDTDAVKEAKEEFFAAYEKALELAGSYEYESYEYDSDEESSEESSEESDEDSDEESSEESDEDSSEEDSEEEEEEEEEESRSFRSYFGTR